MMNSVLTRNKISSREHFQINDSIWNQNCISSSIMECWNFDIEIFYRSSKSTKIKLIFDDKYWLSYWVENEWKRMQQQHHHHRHHYNYNKLNCSRIFKYTSKYWNVVIRAHIIQFNVQMSWNLPSINNSPIISVRNFHEIIQTYS